MPPPAKKRKISGATYGPRGIAAFGTVSKSQSQSLSSKKDVLEESVCLEAITVSTIEKTQVKRRKLEVTNHIVDEQTTPTARQDSTDEKIFLKPSTQSKTKKVSKKLTPKATTNDTPTKGARTCLESLVLALSPSPPISSQFSPPHEAPLSSAPSIASSDKEILAASDRLKLVEKEDEVQDLIDLYSSFLNALSLHYAHHGSFAPVDLRVLKPTIERCWGRKRICDDDIRRVIAIAPTRGQDKDQENLEQSELCPLSLLDYGNGKVCVEISEDSYNNTIQRRPLDVEKLTRDFARNVQKLWKRRVPSAVRHFTSSLPLAPILPCSSLQKLAPLLSKGQRRLEDLKTGAIKTQITNNLSSTKVSHSPTSSKSQKATSDRVTSLLDRIRAKEMHQSTLPSGPSPASLARRSALQRLEEVVAILEILTNSGGASGCRSTLGAPTNGSPIEFGRSYSFTMPTLVQHFQMSLRNPISRDEAILCVRLLADEIVPAWIAVREVGKLLGVTVRGRMGVTREEIRGRVQEALKKP